MNGRLAQATETMKPKSLLGQAGLLPVVFQKRDWNWVLVFGLTLLSVVFLAVAVEFVVSARPSVGGIDFYFYLLYARELADGLKDVMQERYIYFPGVFTFWASVFRISDGSLASLQWAYLGVVIVNGVLVGAILSTITRQWQVGVVATGIYLIVASRIDGLAGITEPIATVPFLFGLWAWIILRGLGKAPVDLVALGSGLGLALYAKQQGGLLALGALGLLPALSATFVTNPYTVRQFLILPTTAVGVFSIAMVVEGGGLPAIQRGLLFAQEYPAQGAWAEHTLRVFQLIQPLSNLLLSGCALWILSLVALPWRRACTETVVLTLGLTVFSVVGCLLQFLKRGYLHYALLSLPSILIAAGLTVFLVIKLLEVLAARWPQYSTTVVLVGGIFFLSLNSLGTTSFVEDMTRMMATVHQRKAQEDFGKAFVPLCRRVQSGAALLMIPPRENRVHWFCDTRSIAWRIKNPWEHPDPYVWKTLLAEKDLNQVFLFSKSYGDFEKRFFENNDWSVFLQELELRGFRRTFDFEFGQLFRRDVR